MIFIFGYIKYQKEYRMFFCRDQAIQEGVLGHLMNYKEENSSTDLLKQYTDSYTNEYVRCLRNF